MNLYELEKEYQEFLVLAEELYAGGSEEDIKNFENSVILNQENFRNKALSYAKLLRNLDSEVASIKDEVSRLEKLQEAKKKIIDLLEVKLAKAMQTYSISELDLNIFRFRILKSQSVEIDADANIPTSFMSIKTTTTPNKRALRQAIEAGKEIPGVRIKDNFHLKR
jgi:hypothetical protein